MASDFEKALERAASERNAADEAKQQQEHERMEKVGLARSIVDAYLSDLGPQVVATLRKLGIAPVLQPQWNAKAWTFTHGHDGDRSPSWFALNENGEFVADYVPRWKVEREGGPRTVGFYAAYWQGDLFYWQDCSYENTWKHLFVKSDTDKVYLKLGVLDRHLKSDLTGRWSGERYGEVSEFIADYIYTSMLK